MKKFRPLLLAICLALVLSISSLGSATVLADDGGPQGGSNSTKTTPPPPPPQKQLTTQELVAIISAIMGLLAT